MWDSKSTGESKYDDASRIYEPEEAEALPLSHYKSALPTKKRHHIRSSSILELKRTDGIILNKNLYGVPIEEVDPFIILETFCALSRKYGKYYVFRFSASKSCWIWDPMSRIRRFAIAVITHRYFDGIVIGTIICNCLALAASTNEFGEGERQVRSYYDVEVDSLENVFMTIYILEMVLKIVAKGFVLHKYSYLRNYWNMVDFTVVVSGCLIRMTEIEDEDEGDMHTTSHVQVLRIFRVFRVLKCVSLLPGLKTMINALMNSALQLLEVMALNFFCLMIFSLFALEFFMGKLSQKCVLIKGGVADEGDNLPLEMEPPWEKEKLWYDWAHDSRNWAMRDPAYPEEEPQPCANDTVGRACPVGYICLAVGGNPDDGWTSFDNFQLSMLTTFQILTTDFWERPYELVLSTSGFASVTFFIVVLFFGSFYLLNLMLAVVALSYESEVGKSQLIPKTKSQQLYIKRKYSNFSFRRPHKLNLKLLTEYRRESTEKIEEKVRKASKFEHSLAFDKPEYETIPNEIKPQSLGDTILGILGRKMSLEGEMSKFEILTGGHSRIDPVVTASAPHFDDHQRGSSKHVAVPIDKADDHSKQFDDVEESESEDDEKVCRIRYGRERYKVYPHTSLMVQCFRRKYRLAALKTRETLRPIVTSQTFEYFITTSIIVNTIILSLEYHGQSETLNIVSEHANNFFMMIFTLELVFKLLAFQKEFFASWWNIFDLVIVGGSFIDIMISGQSFTVIRGLRLLRVFKLAQSWITMKVLLNIIFTTFDALGNLTLLLVIVIYCFAILGMQVVGSGYTPSAFGATKDNFAPYPRWNFQNFGYAFLMVFRIICGEWTESMAECFTAQKADGTQWKCFLIYIPTLVFGNFVVLNLFLALLLESFNSEDLKVAKEKEMEASGKLQNLKKVVVMLMLKNKDADRKRRERVQAHGGDNASMTTLASIISLPPGATKMDCAAPDTLARIRFKMAARKVMIKNEVAKAETRIEESIAARQAHMTGNRRCSSFGLVHEHTPTLSARSVVKIEGNCIPPKCMECNCDLCHKIRATEWKNWDSLRAKAVKIVGHPAFEWTILGCIFASSITLAFEDIHLENNKKLKNVLFILNCTFCVIFILEMIIKWFALGLWGYFTNVWCLLDVFIVVISIVTLSFEIHHRAVMNHLGHLRKSKFTNFASLKALRTLRALRPLRAISRWGGMKIIVNALMYAIPLIFNVFLVCLLFWLVFSIMGVQLFKGKLYKCVDINGETLPAKIAPSKAVCCSQADTLQHSWINIVPNFDNVLMGYLSLLQIATYEGWMELITATVDAVDVDVQPIRENQPFVMSFFVVFIVFGGFFTLNLFIGVMVDNFGMLKKKYEGNLLEMFLTPRQRHYYTTMKKLGTQKPRKIIRRPTNKISIVFYELTMSRRFEIAVFLTIFLNLLLLCFETYNQNPVAVTLLSSFNAFFTAIYIIEAGIKILGLRYHYFLVAWNIFDFILVIASLLDLILIDLTVDFPIPPTMLRIIRIFRIGRILRLVKAAKGIRKLLYALVVSLPALVNIGALIALITFIYAILGMSSFSGVAKSGAVDQVVNWDTFMNSCIVLLRLMIAAGWNDVFTGLIQTPVTCGPYRSSKCGLDGEPDCPSAAVAITYFVSYLVIVFIIIINMYTAIILENYVEANQEEEIGIVVDDLEMFYIRWSRYDPKATQFLGFEHLSEFLGGLDPPFRIPKPNIVAIVAFNLPICRGNKIHCLDILHALVKHVLGEIDDTDNFRKLQEQMERKFSKQFPTRRLLDVISSTRIWKIQQNAAVIIQRAWRAYIKREQLYSDESLTDVIKHEYIQM